MAATHLLVTSLIFGGLGIGSLRKQGSVCEAKELPLCSNVVLLATALEVSLLYPRWLLAAQHPRGDEVVVVCVSPAGVLSHPGGCGCGPATGFLLFFLPLEEWSGIQSPLAHNIPGYPTYRSLGC